ncbi:hypothetical protein MKX03_029858 [Papaver bracteatum]|nr:hypothetical protein MKX03_029858 [Papaver bracteatum]
MADENAKMIFLLVLVMLGMFAAETEAFKGKCYFQCMVGCAARRPGKRAFICPVICLPKCLFCRVSLDNASNDYCKFGCAMSNCIKNSTPRDPREDEVEHCVNSYCANKCVS